MSATTGGKDAALGGITRLTLNFVNANRDYAKVEGSVVASLLYGAYGTAYNAALSQAFPQAPGIVSLLGTNGAALNVDLRKLYLSIYTQLLDLSIGRQIINFGVGSLFSPIDAFSRPSLSDLDYARNGSDVVRVEVPFGEVSGLEAVSTVSDSRSGLTSAMKAYTNIGDYDLAAVGLYRGAENEVIAGVDFKGDLLVGVYGEAVQHFLLDPWKSYFEGMFGVDYSFSRTLFLSAEYYYNGNPALPGSLSPAAVAAAGRVFLNRHYLYAAARYVLNDLMSTGASAVYDISAGTMLATIQYTYNVVQNGDLLAYVRYLTGDVQGGATSPGASLLYGIQFRVVF